MQRIAPNSLPPRGNSGGRQAAGGPGESPALRMASRIRAEQGPERAAQYLSAMEPFLAPAERAHIAEQLNLRIPPPHTYSPPQQEPMPASAPGGMGGMPGFGGMPNMGSLGNLGNIMQMLQLFQGFSGGMGGNPGQAAGSNPVQLAQMLGNLMGNKKS